MTDDEYHRTTCDRLERIGGQLRLAQAELDRLRRDHETHRKRDRDRRAPILSDTDFQTAWGSVGADSDGGDCD